ncbi:unnamed protein product [Cyprideis torosa]|uniref:Uncharacterized protein n=1 Tax=Cyprideis torosa TaxID=163714 RepID=A0A7R8WEB0_9CRUS|nr:unnamed protein product [Cyprideis torosa]CAG0895527.1 unnamed protein product [Cyprideis torosa]
MRATKLTGNQKKRNRKRGSRQRKIQMRRNQKSGNPLLRKLCFLLRLRKSWIDSN